VNGGVVVIGVGNALRGDDGAGLRVAHLVRRLVPACVPVLTAGGEPTGLLELWDGAAAVLLADAGRCGAPPGTVHRLDVARDGLPAVRPAAGTHAGGLAEAVALGRALDRLPPRVVVYAVEGHRFALGTTMTPAVRRGARTAAGALATEVLAALEACDGHPA
jgi:hydrogenase maturation protease